MPKCWFSLTLIFSYKERIVDSVLILENPDQRKPVFWRIYAVIDLYVSHVYEKQVYLLTDLSTPVV